MTSFWISVCVVYSAVLQTFLGRQAYGPRRPKLDDFLTRVACI